MARQRWRQPRKAQARLALQVEAGLLYQALEGELGRYNACAWLAHVLHAQPWNIHFGTMSDKLLRRAIKAMNHASQGTCGVVNSARSQQ